MCLRNSIQSSATEVDWQPRTSTRLYSLGGVTANQKVINDIKNMLKAEGYNTANVIVTITHADGATVGQTFDLSLSTNQYKLMKIRLTIPYSDVGIFPMKISGSALLDAELVAAKGRATMN